MKHVSSACQNKYKTQWFQNIWRATTLSSLFIQWSQFRSSFRSLFIHSVRTLVCGPVINRMLKENDWFSVDSFCCERQVFWILASSPLYYDWANGNNWIRWWKLKVNLTKPVKNMFGSYYTFKLRKKFIFWEINKVY